MQIKNDKKTHKISKSLSPILPLYWYKQIFQAIQTYFIHQSQKLAQLARRKSLSLKPYQIKLRKITDPVPLIFPKRHLRLNQRHQTVIRIHLLLFLFTNLQQKMTRYGNSHHQSSPLFIAYFQLFFVHIVKIRKKTNFTFSFKLHYNTTF